jgi:hypothetical protein
VRLLDLTSAQPCCDYRHFVSFYQCTHQLTPVQIQCGKERAVVCLAQQQAPQQSAILGCIHLTPSRITLHVTPLSHELHQCYNRLGWLLLHCWLSKQTCPLYEAGQHSVPDSCGQINTFAN